MGTYVFLAQGEALLHRLLRILVKWLALRPLGQSHRKVDEYQALNKDVALAGEIASGNVAYLELEQITACKIRRIKAVGKGLATSPQTKKS